MGIRDFKPITEKRVELEQNVQPRPPLEFNYLFTGTNIMILGAEMSAQRATQYLRCGFDLDLVTPRSRDSTDQWAT